jgi:hypothetical protein
MPAMKRSRTISIRLRLTSAGLSRCCLSGMLMMIFYACTSRGPAPAPKIDEERFAAYYASYMVLSHQLKLGGSDSAGIAHGVDSLQRSLSLKAADIRETLEYYHQHLPEWRELNSRILRRLGENPKKIKE